MHFVITHKPLDYEVPFIHKLISVGDDLIVGALKASEFCGDKINSETSLGSSRSLPAILKLTELLNNDEPVFISSYRMFMGADLEDTGFTSVPINHSRTIISKNFLLKNYNSLILNKIPDGIDIVISKPINFKISIISQYASAHHVEDLLNGISLAIELGLIDPLIAAHKISGNVLIPFGFLAARKTLRLRFLRDMWRFITAYYQAFGNKLRIGYQQRYIDFVLERIFSIYIYQMIHKESLKFLTSKPVFISDVGNYEPSI